MKRSIIHFNLSILLCAIVGCTSPPAEKKEVNDPKKAAENELPFMRIRLLDQSEIDIRQLTGKIVLVFFQPDCDHCQREASEIAKNLGAFKDASLYFITSDTGEKAAKFAIDYNLSGVQDVYFGLTYSESVLNNFGPIATPSIYIYSEDRKLIKAFNGEVDISMVMKYL